MYMQVLIVLHKPDEISIFILHILHNISLFRLHKNVFKTNYILGDAFRNYSRNRYLFIVIDWLSSLETAENGFSFSPHQLFVNLLECCGIIFILSKLQLLTAVLLFSQFLQIRRGRMEKDVVDFRNTPSGNFCKC